MTVNKKSTFLTVCLLLIYLLSGCKLPDLPLKVIFPAGPHEPQHDQVTAKKFEDAGTQGETSKKSIIELSEKYTRLVEKSSVMQQKNQDLLTENKRLKEQIAIMEPQLKQTQKELTQANDQLIETNIELNNWKVSVLGFQNEMRSADKAQLEALIKIFEMLGGQIREPNAPTAPEATQSQPGRTGS